MEQKQPHFAYRCPGCGSAVNGLFGRFALSANLLRLKCPCGESAFDAEILPDGKVSLSVPCVFCKKNHRYTVATDILFDREAFFLACPYAAMDIAFFGTEDQVETAIRRTEKELTEVLADLEADSLSDIQPTDLSDDEILPEPAAFDTIRFVMKDLEAEGKITCPCGKGEGYDLRYAPGGIEIYCPACGASHLFSVTSASAAEEYLTLDALTLGVYDNP